MSDSNSPTDDLADGENKQLAPLLSRARWPLEPNVFRALVGMSVSVPIELAVFDNDQILLFYRRDEEYEGNHMPGTVLRGNETVSDAINRLRVEELDGGYVTKPVSLGWIEVVKGSGPGQDPARHQISLLHACWLVGPYTGSGVFFSLDDLPSDLLPHHRVLIHEIVARIEGRRRN